MNTVQRLMAYEDGQLDHDDTIALFQQLVDSGLAWQLQGSYGRQAARFIESGEVTPRHNQGARTHAT